MFYAMFCREMSVCPFWTFVCFVSHLFLGNKDACRHENIIILRALISFKCEKTLNKKERTHSVTHRHGHKVQVTQPAENLPASLFHLTLSKPISLFNAVGKSVKKTQFDVQPLLPYIRSLIRQLCLEFLT